MGILYYTGLEEICSNLQLSEQHSLSLLRLNHLCGNFREGGEGPNVLTQLSVYVLGVSNCQVPEYKG